MKKTIAALLALSMIVCFAGCNPDTQEKPTQNTNAVTEESTNEATVETTEAVFQDVVPEQAPMAAVSLPISTTNSYTENDVLLFTYKCQTISLIIPDSEIEDKVILDFQKRLDDFSVSAQELNLQSKDDYQNKKEWTPYFYNILYNPTRIDLSVLSLFGTSTSWSGGAHPTRNCTSANYDLITGDVLTLGSILTHEDALESLCTLLTNSVAEIKAEKYIIDGYEEIIRSRLIGNESYNEAWYFDHNGLNFYFSPYEIAPYSSGIITVTIPYEKLTGIIEDKYFPPETDIATGLIQAKRQTDADLSVFTQIAEVVLDKEGEMVFLYTDRAVHNLTVQVGSWNTDGTVFTEDCTVFATPMLTPGDAAMVQLSVPDTMPNVRIQYESNGKNIVEYISQSGKDGTILLIPESEL